MTNTLTTSPVAPLLGRLFDAGDAMSLADVPGLATLSAEDRARMMRSTSVIAQTGHL